MEASGSFSPPRMSWFDAASGLLLMLFMGGGYIFGMLHMPELGSASDIVAWYHRRGSVGGGVSAVLITIAFFFTFWFFGNVWAWMRAAEGNGPLTYISLFGAVSFTTVFAAMLALVLAPSMLIGKGIGDDAIYLMHAASLLSGVTTAVCGPACFIPIAVLSFRTGLFPKWLTWLTVACAVGSVTPILGAFSLTGPLNVGNGWVGIHIVAASWVGWCGAASLYFLSIRSSGHDPLAVGS